MINLEPLKKEADLILYDCQQLEIKTKDDYAKAGDILKIVNNKIKSINEKRFEYTKPLDESKKRIIADFKTVTEPLENFIKELKQQMTSWWQVEQARLDKEQKEIEDKALAEAKKNNVSEIDVPVVNDIKTNRGDISTTTMRKMWKWKIVKEASIPKKYMSVDPVKINQAIKNGERKITGIKIYEEATPVIR